MMHADPWNLEGFVLAAPSVGLVEPLGALASIAPHRSVHVRCHTLQERFAKALASDVGCQGHAAQLPPMGGTRGFVPRQHGGHTDDLASPLDGPVARLRVVVTAPHGMAARTTTAQDAVSKVHDIIGTGELNGGSAVLTTPPTNDSSPQAGTAVCGHREIRRHASTAPPAG